MYRATAEIVSGTRVYADGKWLRCIGNKRVSVGDRIWTDGRCVYGHEQEAQQPQVIITPQEDDEGIPIIRSTNSNTYRLSIFQKNKLKDVAEIRHEDGKINLYNYVAGEFVFVGETEIKSDQWTSFSLMINDNKKSAFIYDKSTHYKGNFYPDGVYSTYFCTDTRLIASNIDSNGDRFDMVIRYESEFVKFFNFFTLSYEIKYKNVQEKAVEILKNGEVVHSVALQPIIDKVIEDCPNTDQLYFAIMHQDAPPGFTPIEQNIYSVEPYCNLAGEDLYDSANPQHFHAFIDNEQKWYFWLTCRCLKETVWSRTLDDDDDQNPRPYDVVTRAGHARSHLSRVFLVTASGAELISEEILEFDLTGNAEQQGLKAIYTGRITATEKKIILPMQDGYYCEAYDFFNEYDLIGKSPVDDRVFGHHRYAFLTFYTPKNEEIFKGIFHLPIMFPICRVKGGHLLYVSHSAADILLQALGTDTYKGVKAPTAGLYLIAGGQCKPIKPTMTHMINQKLRPMKKIRNWQNRLKSIEIEQEEI